MRIGHEAKPAALGVDQARFTEIYARHAPLIQAYCARRVSPSQVTDAVTETFLVAWRRLDEIADANAALLWLYGVAYRVVSDRWRSVAATTEVIVLLREETDQVLAAAARLRPIDQEILRLTMWEELAYADVAAVLSIEPDAIKQRVYRARRNLAKEFNKLSRDRKPPATTAERCLAKTEDEVARLFAAANPVLRPELLDPPAPLDASDLTATIGTDDGSGERMAGGGRARWLLLPAVAAAVITIAALAVLLYRTTRSADPAAVDSGTDPLEVAEAFMDAWEDGDGESVAALFTAHGGFGHWPSLIRGERESSGSTIGGPETESLPALHEWFEALDWDYRAEGCGRPTHVAVVACEYSFDNDVMEALDLDPVEGVFFLTIEDGKVARARSYVVHATVGRYPFLWDRFLDWVMGAHPDEFAQMWDAETNTPRLDPAPHESWRRILDEFVAVEAAPWLTREKFIRQADAICRGRSSHQVEPRTWTPVGTWLFPDPDDAVAQLKALPLPERSRTEAEQLVTLSERFADLLRQIRVAWDAGDEGLADRLSQQALDLTVRLDGLLPGLEGCPVTPVPNGR